MTVSAVLFARNARKVARFYREVFGATLVDESDAHSTLGFSGFSLVVHQIPPHLMESGEVGAPPERRESGAIRLDYVVADVSAARLVAAQLGGQIDAQSPPWASATASFFLGYDPEGNVFGVA
jgi:predicted enzyme related to lactoylglutathione lyase